MDNTFEIFVEADGKIRVTSKGGFGQEVHADADAFLKLVQELAGGGTVTKKLAPSLANPHGMHTHDGKHYHSH